MHRISAAQMQIRRSSLARRSGSGPNGAKRGSLGYRASGTDTSPELRNALGLLENYSGVVLGIGTCRLAVIHDARVRPVGNAHATIAALLIAHDVAPLSINVAVTISE